MNTGVLSARAAGGRGGGWSVFCTRCVFLGDRFDRDQRIIVTGVDHDVPPDGRFVMVGNPENEGADIVVI
ncbi:MAG: hypothetical protein VYE68_05255 [Acidobacteriota bacterium]|nr:hypothetical protein [Acidobacteriota bacterium]